MHRWLFDLLICPDCPGEIPLTVTSGDWTGDALTTDRLPTDTGWDRKWVAGTLIFDGGAVPTRRIPEVYWTKGKLERVMRFELTTSTLARLRSTPELHPHPEKAPQFICGWLRERKRCLTWGAETISA